MIKYYVERFEAELDDGRIVRLTWQDGTLLSALKTDVTVPYNKLIRAVWDDQMDAAYRSSLGTIIWRLRKRLGLEIAVREKIGYLLVTPVVMIKEVS